MSTTTNQNWWQRQHPVAKGFMIFTGIALVVWGGSKVFGNKKDDKNLPPSSPNTQLPPNTQQSSETSNTAAHVDTPPAQTPANTVMPPEGKVCGPVHEDFDEDFNYCKCGEDWYTISKANPKDAQYAGKYLNWVDIKTHATDPTLAVARLNARYTN